MQISDCAATVIAGKLISPFPRAGKANVLETLNAKPASDFELFGFHTKLESRRRNKLRSEFGQLGAEVADFEHKRSVSAYKREFLDDIPYSVPMIYFKDLYTIPHMYPAFKMTIDPEERSGLTELGFEELRGQIRETARSMPAGKENEVVVWYSPPGPGGEGKFRDTYFDSGRIYVSIVQVDDTTISFDIKVDEGLFPAASFLDDLSNNEKHADSWHYLAHPFRTGLSFREFTDKVRTNWGDKQIYIKQRHTDPRLFTVGEIVNGMEFELSSPSFLQQLALLNQFRGRFENFRYQAPFIPKVSAISDRNDYLQLVYQAAQKNGGEVMLYGCSATGLRTLSDLEDVSFSFNSIFDTSFRIQNLIKDKDPKKDPSLCRCGSPSVAHFHCPVDKGGCHHPIIVGRGKDQCPSCGKEATCK